MAFNRIRAFNALNGNIHKLRDPVILYFNIMHDYRIESLHCFAKGAGNSVRIALRAITKMFQFAFPATGSRYFPIRPVMYSISPLTFISTLAGAKRCSKS